VRHQEEVIKDDRTEREGNARELDGGTRKKKKNKCTNGERGVAVKTHISLHAGQYRQTMQSDEAVDNKIAL
jgi:hypothetical protein